MAGISSKAANSLSNKKQYAGNELQNKEFNDGSGLEFYDFNARTYDQQIGRFHQIDPMTDEGGQKSLTPFQYCGNNPVLNSDPDGKFFFAIPIVYYAVAAGVAAIGTYIAVKHPINVARAVDALREKVNETSTSTPTAPAMNANAFIPLSAQMAKAKAEDDLATKNPKGGTYVLKDENDEVARSGRTNDLERREQEHARGEETNDKKFEVDVRTDDKKVQRGREQQLHEQYNPPLNKIKPIADKNPKRPLYMQAAQDFMDKAIKGQ
jgi:RHS repeat-associated protein